MRYRVAVIGASFGGIALAHQFREKVLVVDRALPGQFQSSACGLPISWVRYLDLAPSVLAESPRFRCIMNELEVPLVVDDPFCTLDYRKFCELGTKRPHVEFLRAHVKNLRGSVVETSEGEFEAEVIVNASGWNPVGKEGDPPPKGVGVETEIPYALDEFRFYFDRAFIEDGYGYAWAFPCGQTTRFGVIKYYGSHNLKSILTDWLSRLGAEPADLHGGAVPYIPRWPIISGNTFNVGDAAGQCFPLTGEGIRPTLYFATLLGWMLQSWIDGHLSLDDVKRNYEMLMRYHERKLRQVWALQRAVNRFPNLVMGSLLRWGTRGKLFKLATEKYLGCFRPPVGCEQEIAGIRALAAQRGITAS